MDFYGTLLVKVLYRAPSLITHTILRTDLMHEGTLLVKVLYRAPSLITHTILRTDLMHEGARPRTSVSSWNCV